MTVLAADPAIQDPEMRTNADIIRECMALGYIGELDYILDPTYGEGKWWSGVHLVDSLFVRHDLYKLDGVDFCYLPHFTNTFDVVTFDPPYCAKGGRSTSGIPEMDDRFGQDTAPATPAALQTLINTGLTECTRVTKVGGKVLVKCMSYISGGKFWPGEFLTAEHALRRCPLVLVDRFYHGKAPGPQPTGRRQLHARNNVTTLYVFEKVER